MKACDNLHWDSYVKVILDSIGPMELYYLANKENHAVDVAFRLQDQPSKVIVWHHVTGRRTTLKKRADGSYRLRLKPVESVCMTYRIIH